jgi:hypothetical protein
LEGVHGRLFNKTKAMVKLSTIVNSKYIGSIFQ